MSNTNDESPVPLEVEAEAARKKKKAEDEDEDAKFRSNVKTIVSAVALAILIRIVIFEAFEIEGPSMQPTLLDVDRVIVAKCLYGLFLPRMNEAVLTWGHPEHGDVVIVRSPFDDIDIVKRVIGMPGDTVEVRDYHPIVNGRPLLVRETGRCVATEQKEYHASCRTYQERHGDHTYTVSHDAPTDANHDGIPDDHTSYSDFPRQTVPPGHVFVMGDHRDQSNDSRNPGVGMIPFKRLKGPALFIYISGPLRNIRWSRTFQGVD